MGGQSFGAALGDVVGGRLNISTTYLLLATSAMLVWFSALRSADTAVVDRLVREAG